MKYNFDQLPNRRKTESVKWNKYPEDVLPLWVADMDFMSPEPVIRALRERLEHGVFGYPKDLPQLKEVVVDRMEKRYNWRILPEEMIILPGVVSGFNVACQALATPDGSVLVCPPVYKPILEAPAHAGMNRQEIELKQGAGGQYQIDNDAFKAALTDDVRLFLLCNPHNPVGKVFKREKLEVMAATCLEKGVVICSDEIHNDFVYPGHKHIPIASISAEVAENTITLLAPSKTYNLAGLKCSVVIIQNAHLRKIYKKTFRGLVGWVNVFGLVAGLTAYREGQDWLDQLRVYLEANRDFVYEFVSQEMPGVKMVRPEGTYLAWLDCRQTSINGNPYKFFLEKARVALVDGEVFGKGGSGFVRLNFGCPRFVLEEALERMKRALNSV